MMAAEALREAIARLTAAGVPDAPRDARRLLAYALGVAPDRLTLHMGDAMDTRRQATFDTAVAARCRRQPVSQITGKRNFYGREFTVTRDTLDPRPETETLIAAALSRPFGRVLDLGTGTGCILLTLLAERPSAGGLGVDISTAALEVARRNAATLGVADRAAFAVSEWFHDIAGQFDLIVSNPPYIAASEMPTLLPEVRDWEPHLALTPGGDGLDAYRAIAAGTDTHLAPKGRLIVEIGATQAANVCEILRRAGFAQVVVLPDMDGRDRVIVAETS
jgi:release factor glutamine methyltransferase